MPEGVWVYAPNGTGPMSWVLHLMSSELPPHWDVQHGASYGFPRAKPQKWLSNWPGLQDDLSWFLVVSYS